jgi:hypothetical protein
VDEKTAGIVPLKTIQGTVTINSTSGIVLKKK